MSFKILTTAILFIAIAEIETTIYDSTQNHMYNYIMGDAMGPDNWPGVCISGTMQSPIHILSTDLNGPQPKLSFFGGVDETPREIHVINNGFGVFFKFVYHYLNAPKIYGEPLKSDLYQFDSFSYHNIREHTKSGQNPVAEIEFQFLHFNLKYETFEKALVEPNGLAVIAVRHRVTNPSKSNLPVPLLDMVGSVYNRFTELVQQPGRITYAQALGFDLNNIPLHYSYGGSLSTPPCNENVQWFLLRDKIDLYGPDIPKLQNFELWNGVKFSPNNNRPQQPIGGRIIYRY